MFEHKLAQQAEQQDDCVEFLKLYERFRQDILDPTADRVRIARFEIKIDQTWKALSQDKRDILTAALLAKKILPEEVALAVKHLGAKITKVA